MCFFWWAWPHAELSSHWIQIDNKNLHWKECQILHHSVLEDEKFIAFQSTMILHEVSINFHFAISFFISINLSRILKYANFIAHLMWFNNSIKLLHVTADARYALAFHFISLYFVRHEKLKFIDHCLILIFCLWTRKIGSYSENLHWLNLRRFTTWNHWEKKLLVESLCD